MREMKDSGVEWIGKITRDSKIVKVKNLFKYKKVIVSEDVDNYERLALTLAGIIKRSKDDSVGLQPEKFAGYQILEQNELVFKLIDLENIKTSRVGLSSFTGIVSPVYIILTNSEDDNRFYYYWFISMYYNNIFNHLGGDGVRSSLSVRELLNFPILKVSKEKRNRIANYLDDKCSKIDEIIAKEETNIRLLREYKQVVTSEAVTKGLKYNCEIKKSQVDWIEAIPSNWEKKRLKQVFKFVKGLPITKANLEENGIPVISYGQIHSKQNCNVGVALELIRYVNESYFTSNKEALVKKGDFIFADTSEDLIGCGNNVYIDTNERLFAGYHTIILKSQDVVDNRYLGYLFNTDCWRSQIRKRVSGIKLFSITQKILKGTTIFLPPVEEQIDIANYLDMTSGKINEIIVKKQQLIKKLIEYKKSLIYEVVTGKREV